jgi:hypothetical protein
MLDGGAVLQVRGLPATIALVRHITDWIQPAE